VVALKMFEKAEMAPSTFAPHGSAYAAGYAGAAYIVKNLATRRSSSSARLRVRAGPVGRREGRIEEARRHGGILESPVGTSDFTPYLTKVAEMKPEIVMLATGGWMRSTSSSSPTKSGSRKDEDLVQLDDQRLRKRRPGPRLEGSTPSCPGTTT